MTFWKSRWAPWALFGATLVSLLVIGAVMAYANPPEPGRCTGLGWGCSLYGWDLVVFIAYFTALPYVVVLAVVLGLVSLLPERFATVRVTVAAIGLVVPWTVVAYAGMVLA